MEGDTQGNRIRALFESADESVVIIAPYIKVEALRSLLEVVPAGSFVRCVSRWLPKDVAAGVSDPEILNLLEERGNFTLSLVERLHAKLYIAGDRCLAGSANVTLAGLGEGGEYSNVEILVEATIDDPGISATLESIAKAERPATRYMMESVRLLAERLPDSSMPTAHGELPWFPCSRNPERAFRFYKRPPGGYLVAADHALLKDLARSNLQPGLGEGEFQSAIRELLISIPIARAFLEGTEDKTLTRADASVWLQEICEGDLSTNDLWVAFVNWMAHYFRDRVLKQEVSEIVLRRARLLD